MSPLPSDIDREEDSLGSHASQHGAPDNPPTPPREHSSLEPMQLSHAIEDGHHENDNRIGTVPISHDRGDGQDVFEDSRLLEQTLQDPKNATAVNDGSDRRDLPLGATDSISHSSTSARHAKSESDPSQRETTSKAVHQQSRIGKVAFCTLILTSMTISGSLAFIGFLWFSDINNETWHWVVVNDHLITIVTGLSKAIETSIQLQLSLESAMIAGILLENFHVALVHVAAVSLARLSGGSLNLLLNLWRQAKFSARPKHALHSWVIIFLMVVAAVVLGFTQVVTIVLNRNIRLQSLPGFNVSSSQLFGFRYDYNATSFNPIPVPSNGWNGRLSSFPTFAEYNTPGIETSGVSDTGASLRAFLPYESSTDRQNLQHYRGKATIVDVRATCQVPQLLQAEVAAQNGALLLRGQIGASVQTPRLDNRTVLPVGSDNTSFAGWRYDDLVPYECTVPTVANETNWQVALCQLPEGGSETSMWSGGLISMFQPPTPQSFSDFYDALNTQNWGQAYIFLNATRGSDYDWRGALNGGIENSPYLPVPAFQHRNEWIDLIFSDGSLVLSATICYTSFATADIPVVMSSKSNRTEPNVPFDFLTGRYDYEQVRLQLGQIQGQESAEDRGILSLDPQRADWLALPTELPTTEPYIRQYFNMKTDVSEGEDANFTSILCQDTPTLTTTNPDAFLRIVQPDASITSLLQEIVTNGGSVAFALQSLYTIMAANIYYNKLPEFDASSEVYKVDFKVVNAPMQWWGFFVVLGVVLAHFLCLTTVTMLFLKQTTWTYLGEAWMIVAQTRGAVVDQEVLPLMDSGVKGDKMIKKQLEQAVGKYVRVGLGIPSSDAIDLQSQGERAEPLPDSSADNRPSSANGQKAMQQCPQIVEWEAQEKTTPPSLG